jgi:WD40 repeat protein/serine/threonine protein kinase
MGALLEHTQEFHVTPHPKVPGYEILEELGRGAMGVVYKARQQRLNRLVALKILLPELAGLPEKMARFGTEANAIARLQHPNIVQVFEVGEVDGLPYFSLELVEGGSLADKLGRPWPVSQAVAFVEQLARAIHYAHERGIIHRDLKPANILLQMADGRLQIETEKNHAASQSAIRNLQSAIPKITDFGLAKLLDEKTDNDHHLWRTQMGVVLGTPPYMAPEQAAGRIREIGPATDIHALGAILYEILTGRPPFRAGSMLETLEQVKFQTPPPPTQLSGKKDAKLDAICLRCLEKDPRQRYPSAATLADDLAGYRSQSHQVRTGTPRQGNRPAVVALQIALAIVSTVGSGLTVWQVFQAEQRQRSNEASLLEPPSSGATVLPSPRTAGRGLEQPPNQEAWQALNQALACFNKADVGQGMLWLARSFQVAPPENQALQHLIRVNLASWGSPLKPLSLEHRARISAVGLSPNGQTVLTASWDLSARLWEANTGKPIGPPLEHNSTVRSAAFSPDGRRVITGAGALDKTARIWDAGTGQLVCPPLQHPCAVSAAQFTPNGNVAVTVGADHAVRLWNAANGQPLKPPLVHWGEVLALAVSPDGRTILTGCSDSAARLWDSQTGMLMGQPISHPGPVLAVAFSSDSQRFLTGCRDGKARLWSTANCSQVAEFGHKAEVNIVSFSSDGRWILTASQDATARLWDATTLQPHGAILHHSGPITTALFSSDSSTLFIGDAGTGRFWDVATAMPIGPVLHHPAPITAAAFAPSLGQQGRLLVTGDSDGTARLWKLPEPVSGDQRQIVSWVEQITGKKLETLPKSSQVAATAPKN